MTQTPIPYLTVSSALINKVKFEVPEETLHAILVDRGLDGEMDYGEAPRREVRLAYADLLKWFILGPSKVNNTTDSDNGWSHGGGGYELTPSDLSRLKAEANAIYEELEPTSKLKRRCTFKITSHGVKRSNVSPYGMRLPHINK